MTFAVPLPLHRCPPNISTPNAPHATYLFTFKFSFLYSVRSTPFHTMLSDIPQSTLFTINSLLTITLLPCTVLSPIPPPHLSSTWHSLYSTPPQGHLSPCPPYPPLLSYQRPLRRLSCVSLCNIEFWLPDGHPQEAGHQILPQQPLLASCLRHSATCLRHSATCLRYSENMSQTLCNICLRYSATCLRHSATFLRYSATCLRYSENMSQTLCNMSQTLCNMSQTLCNMSQTLSNISQIIWKHVSDTLQHVSDTLQHFSDTLQHVSDTLQHFSDTLQHVSDTLQHFSDTLQHVSDILQHVSDTLQHVSDTLQHVSDTLQHVSDTLQHVSDTLNAKHSIIETCYQISYSYYKRSLIMNNKGIKSRNKRYFESLLEIRWKWPCMSQVLYSGRLQRCSGTDLCTVPLHFICTNSWWSSTTLAKGINGLCDVPTLNWHNQLLHTDVCYR